MLTFIEKVRNFLRRSRFKYTTSKIDDCQVWVGDQLSKFISFYEHLKEVLLFAPVIYKSYRWDYSSLFIILLHWLKRMEDSHKNDRRHLDAWKRVKEIHLCVLLLERICSDNYQKIVMEEHDKEWGQLETWLTPIQGSDCYSFNSSRPEAVFKKDKERERKESLKAMKHSEYLYNQDVEMLFNIIKKYHRSWWT